MTSRWVFCLVALLAGLPARAALYWVTVAGLGGEAEYEQRFAGEAAEVDKLLKSQESDTHAYTLSGPSATRDHLEQTLTQVARAARPTDQFVLLLIGHGSFDGANYKFNLPGPDISGTQLAALCDHVAANTQLIVNTTSSSGGSVGALRRRGRAVIAATKSGTEKNATVFSRYFVEALEDPGADADKSNSISALEAFDYAARKTANFYAAEKRLATEHAVFEDTGQGEPVRARSQDTGQGRVLAGLTLVSFGGAGDDSQNPAKRELLAKKEKLQQQIDILKYQKAAMAEDQYAVQLKSLLLQLARTQAELDKPP
jgi:hypothetical protein